MQPLNIATGIRAELPAWVLDETADVPGVIPDFEDRMRLVHRLANRNYKEGNGGPFAALVADSVTGEIISLGVNVVLASGLSSMHAEVVALSLAQVRIGTWDLGAAGGPKAELVVNWRPCAMCYGATMWSGVERLVIAGDGTECEQLTGFDEGPMRENWREEFEQRGITVVQDVLRDEAVATFAAYGGSGALVYNGRQRNSPAAN